MTPNLKPCPFCGGDKAEAHRAYRDSEVRLFQIVRCGSCFAEASGKNDDYSEGARTAVEAWNKRAEDSTPLREIIFDPATMPNLAAGKWTRENYEAMMDDFEGVVEVNLATEET